MDAKMLMQAVLRSEGYSQGFRDGFSACAKFVAESEKANSDGANINKGNTEASQTPIV